MIWRRAFVTMLGGAVAAWPLSSRAQQPERMRRIGIYSGPSQNAPNVQTRLTAFRKGLEVLGWIEGRNVHIDYRYNTANPAEATELVTLRPEVILSTTPGLRP